LPCRRKAGNGVRRDKIPLAMKSLVENLYDNNVIFSYYGFIDTSVLKEVLQITRSKLEGNREPNDTIERVHNAISECVDNIIRHNFYPDDVRVRYKSLLVVSKQDDHYNIDTINVITPNQKKAINDQLNYLHTIPKEELNEMRNQTRSRGVLSTELKTGLVDLVLKADRCDCKFKDIYPNFLFNVNYKINFLN
jgi:hypothetical protein